MKRKLPRLGMTDWQIAHSIAKRRLAARYYNRASVGGVQTAAADRSSSLVAVVVGLERALLRHADIGGLLVAELGQLDRQLVEVERGDLLVEMLGQDVNVVLDRKSVV